MLSRLEENIIFAAEASSVAAFKLEQAHQDNQNRDEPILGQELRLLMNEANALNIKVLKYKMLYYDAIEGRSIPR
jgi:hypothetical protein